MKNVETRLTKAIDFDFSSPKWADILTKAIDFDFSSPKWADMGNNIFDVLK